MFLNNNSVIFFSKDQSILTKALDVYVFWHYDTRKLLDHLDLGKTQKWQLLGVWGMGWRIGCFFATLLFYRFFFVEARSSYSKMVKISNFAHTLPPFYALKMLFRMSTFIYNNSMIRNFASSWVPSPDGCKSEPNCSYKVCSYKKKKSVRQYFFNASSVS